jgi:putative transposase
MIFALVEITFGAMTRVPRNALPETGIFHVTSRGVDRCDIVRDDIDRQTLCMLIRRYGIEAGWRCHVFVVMTNHFHLIVEGQRDSLSVGLWKIKARYAQAFNNRHERTGPLFTGRFAARSIEADEYLAIAVDYVSWNPVRAGLCEKPDDWPWRGDY